MLGSSDFVPWHHEEGRVNIRYAYVREIVGNADPRRGTAFFPSSDAPAARAISSPSWASVRAGSRPIGSTAR